MKIDDWLKKGKDLFGEDKNLWRFVCPICKTSQSVQDYLDAGIEKEEAQNSIALSCIGRKLPNPQVAIGRDTPVIKGKPCNYAGFGLFKLNPVLVEEEEGEKFQVFDFDMSINPKNFDTSL